MPPESFLHYIWRTRRFITDSLQTTTNASLELLNFGHYNTGDGPDFSEGRIRIDQTVWGGQIEMHVRSSDWHLHRHQFDPAYDNVILHVVWEDDEPVLNAQGLAIPTLVLKDLVAPEILSRYDELAKNEHAIPCQKRIGEVSNLILTGWIERMTLERMERKTKELETLLGSYRGDWDAAFFHQMARCLGLPLNAPAMDMLIEQCPLSLLRRYQTDRLALEALLLGVGGFLSEDYFDEYPRQLAKEFLHLKHKHNLNTIPRTVWNFRGLRPASFPMIRLAQLAAVLHAEPKILNPFLELSSTKEMVKVFEQEPHAYWKTHYLFDRLSKSRRKVIGKASSQIILINAVVPFLFLYGRIQGVDTLEEKAMAILDQLPAEKNHITKQWKSIGIEAETALESQALLTLRNNYCKKRRCLECAIGHTLLKRQQRIVDFARDQQMRDHIYTENENLVAA